MGSAARRVSDAVREARIAAGAWSRTPLAGRLRVVRALRFEIAERAERLAAAASSPAKGIAETLVSEVLPLADACRFAECEAPRVLATRQLSRRGRPLWSSRTDVQVAREPWGVVLVVAPSNYPLFLPGVHALQALAAGNAVVVKPGPGGSAALTELAAAWAAAGLPGGLLQVLGEDQERVAEAIDAGVDHVVLTGSERTGKAVLADLAARAVPATMELSGADAVFVLPGADPGFVARALAFGLAWNGGATCIAPRRVFVARPLASELEAALRTAIELRGCTALDGQRASAAGEIVREALQSGGRIVAGGLDAHGRLSGPTVLADVAHTTRAATADLFAPVAVVFPYDQLDASERLARTCPYALGASMFGPEAAARALGARLDVGVVTINDVIVPTADPRVPFGGRAGSGYGTTRGAEGLLAMTRPKALAWRRGRFRPHFDPTRPGDERIFLGTLRVAHSRTVAGRVRAAAELIRALARRGRT